MNILLIKDFTYPVKKDNLIRSFGIIINYADNTVSFWLDECTSNDLLSIDYSSDTKPIINPAKSII